ncbi:DUF7710 domain-containing protein [Variovorax sp. S12S4]|jgi:hypothetical protein|uniref:DUF7710 domain-containing protein n=1 Tax=Variovorax sp. S12S4 TaxID=3029170 RepID=UPI00406C120A
MNHVWIFNGAGARTPSAVFKDRAEAEVWIVANKLSGMLTEYPVGVSVYQWAIQSGNFKIKNDNDRSPEFIQRFSSGAQEHMHYENGVSD